MNDPIILDVPLEVARCPICGGALQAEVSSSVQVAWGARQVKVTCKDTENIPYEQLEHLVLRESVGSWDTTEADVRAWVYTQKPD